MAILWQPSASKLVGLDVDEGNICQLLDIREQYVKCLCMQEAEQEHLPDHLETHRVRQRKNLKYSLVSAIAFVL